MPDSPPPEIDSKPMSMLQTMSMYQQQMQPQPNPGYPSIEGGTSLKRRKDSHDANGIIKKKQRTRVSYSCSECHRRKQKCDRQIPCSHCVARKVPELCKGYTPGKSDTDLNARLSRVEHIVEMALPQYTSRLSSSMPSSDEEDESMNDTNAEPEEDPAGGILQGGRWFGSSASGSVTTQPLLEALHHESKDFPPAAEGATSTAQQRLDALYEYSGANKKAMDELLRTLPEKPELDGFVDYYFMSINYIRYPLYEPSFRHAYESMCIDMNKAKEGELRTIKPGDMRSLPLLFVILATAVRLAPDDMVGNAAERRKKSLIYYWASRRALLVAAAIQSDSLELVLARLLSFRFLVFERRITECWAQLGAAVRTAQALGLHRDGTKLGLDAFNTEYRRRVWTYLYHADRTHALLLGRPPSISDDYCDTLPPSNIPDSALPMAPLVMPQPEPMTRPTLMTFQILRHGLAAITGHIVHHFQSLRRHTGYNDVLALDHELEHFISHLPPAYSLEPDTSLDHVCPYVPVHRFLIISEVFFIRMSLHRPYLLRRHERFSASRKASFQSAKLDFKVRQAFKRSVSQDIMRSLGGAYREFQAAMTAGVSLVLARDGPDSDEMRQILATFVTDHVNLEPLDETTRRELKVIELLLAKSGSPPRPVKAEAVEDPSSLPSSNTAVSSGRYSPNSPLDVQATANILLDISQALPSTSVTSPFAPQGSVSPHSNMAAAASYVQYRRSLNVNTAPAPFPSYTRILHRSEGEPGTSPTLSAEEQESAQVLLDRWCDTASGSVEVMDRTSSGWSLGDGLGPMMNLAAVTDPVPYTEPQEEWTYWENLVETLQRQGSSTLGGTPSMGG